jgi:hypothetical protein
MPPGQKTQVRVHYFDKLDLDANRDGIAYGIKIRVRRHLSEFRDNYVSQNEVLQAAAARARRFLN